MDNERTKNIELCIEQCTPILKKLSYKYKNIYDNDANEAFANACLWVVEMYDKFDRNKGSLVSYIGMIVEHKFIDAYRYNKVHEFDRYATDVYDMDEMNLLPYEKDYEPEGEIILTEHQQYRKDIYDRYEPYIDELSDRERGIFKLFYYNLWDISHIAKSYELSIMRIKEIKRDVLRKLEKLEMSDKIY